MTTPHVKGPRTTRPGGAPSRRELEARRRTAARTRQRLVLVGSIVLLVAAVLIVVHALTQNSDISGSGLHPYISKAPTAAFVPGQPVDGMDCGAMEGQAVHI